MRCAIGYRGYISSRPFCGERAPQHVQNLVIRTYCERNGFQYLLSATELAMSDCFLMLEQLLDSIETLDGIVCYSLQQLPNDDFQRKRVFRRIIEAGRSIHFAVEGLNVSDWASVRRVDEITQVQSLMPLCLSAEELRAAGGMID